MSPDAPIERLGGDEPYAGSQFSVRVERFRHADGAEVEREYVHRVAAAAIVAYDDAHVWLVRQPREAILQYTLELPAGKLDVEGETPLECAQRELGEEIGMKAASWSELKRFYTTPGFAQEEVTLFVATGLEEIEGQEPDPEERLELVRWPLADLDAAIEECADSKTLIGLLRLRQSLG